MPPVTLAARRRAAAARKGATAIAVVTRCPRKTRSDALQGYRQRRWGGCPAGPRHWISHLLGRHLGLPCAHAPALLPLPLDPAYDGRRAAEELGHNLSGLLAWWG